MSKQSNRVSTVQLASWITKRPTFSMCVLVAIASFIVYANALGNGFVFDDIALITENEAIKNYRNIPEIFGDNLWGFLGRASNYYRPIPPLIYMFTYYIAGLTPWVYHLINILLHAGTSALVFLIIVNLLCRYNYGEPVMTMWAALAGALVFATHPIHTEAVTWIAGIMDLACTFFALLSFFCYLYSDRNRLISGPYICSIVSFFLATLAKEPALTLPVIVLIADYMLTETSKRSIIVSVRRIAPYIGVLAIYFALRMHALKGFAPFPSGASSLGLNEAVLNVIYLFSLYLKNLFLPMNLTVLHDIAPLSTWLSWRAFISLIVAMMFMIFGYVTARRNPPMFLGFVFLALPLTPALYLPALVQELRHALADRYIYFGSFGFILIGASILAWIGSKDRRMFLVGMIATIAVAVVFAVLTIERNTIWKDNYTLWMDTLRKAPESPIAHKHLGYALLYRGQSEEGRKHLRIALALDPMIPEAMIELGVQYSKKGLINKAILEFAAALLFDPDSVAGNYNLGLAYQTKGWLKEAIQQYAKVLLIRPDYTDAHVNIGIAYAETGNIDDAIKHLREAIRINPDDATARYNLERALKLR